MYGLCLPLLQAGEVNWAARNGEPVSASWEFESLPSDTHHENEQPEIGLKGGETQVQTQPKTDEAQPAPSAAQDGNGSSSSKETSTPAAPQAPPKAQSTPTAAGTAPATTTVPPKGKKPAATTPGQPDVANDPTGEVAQIAGVHHSGSPHVANGDNASGQDSVSN